MKPRSLALTMVIALVLLLAMSGATLLQQNFGNVPANIDTSTAQAGMFVTGNVTPQVIATAGVFEVITAFDSISANVGATVDTVANTITTVYAGTYVCAFTVDITGAQNTNITVALFIDGSPTSVKEEARITENGDVASTSASGFSSGITVGQTVDIRMTANKSSFSATVQDANYWCFRPLVLE